MQLIKLLFQPKCWLQNITNSLHCTSVFFRIWWIRESGNFENNFSHQVITCWLFHEIMGFIFSIMHISNIFWFFQLILTKPLEYKLRQYPTTAAAFKYCTCIWVIYKSVQKVIDYISATTANIEWLFHSAIHCVYIIGEFYAVLILLSQRSVLL